MIERIVEIQQDLLISIGVLVACNVVQVILAGWSLWDENRHWYDKAAYQADIDHAIEWSAKFHRCGAPRAAGPCPHCHVDSATERM
ncbi:MAG: hypothetical protein NVS2B17_31030 [Candidatus Velthaea sp.]